MNIGVLILFALLGAFICAKTRSAGGAVVFSVLAIVLFISTPVGAGLPATIGKVIGSVSEASTPLTNGSGAAG